MKKLDDIIRMQQAYECMKAQNKHYFQYTNNRYLADINKQIKKRYKKTAYKTRIRWIVFILVLILSLPIWLDTISNIV